MQSLHADSFEAWRDHARTLLSQRIPPEAAHWVSAEQPGLFDTSNAVNTQQPTETISVPKRFLSLAQQAACFVDKHDPMRKWALLYSLLWRVTFEHRNILAVQSDPEVLAVQKMAKSVNRDKHKMKAFVRFQKVSAENSTGEDSELYTSWFEPEHAIIESIAPFFAKRFTGMNWSILTPHGCAHWDQRELKISPGISRPELPKDSYDTFWRAYYCSIFNPARLKEKAMMAEMPKKYWRYLPEAQCIKSLTNSSSSIMQTMIDRETTDPERLSKKSSQLRQAQQTLRANNKT